MLMEILAWIAAVLVFTSFFMKTIVPLRVFAIASNVAFIGYAAVGVAEGLAAKVFRSWCCTSRCCRSISSGCAR